jgi:hypothetical protein
MQAAVANASSTNRLPILQISLLILLLVTQSP